MRKPGFRDWFGLEVFSPGSRFVKEGADLFLLDRVDSTSDFLLGRGAGGMGRRCRFGGWGWQADPQDRHDPLSSPGTGTLAVTRHQSCGRGRHGRQWHDWGGLAMSWVMRPSSEVLKMGLPVWIGLVLTLALQELSQQKIWLKWPNDLLAGGQKLGGVLLDRVGSGASGFVVVGVGLNLDGEPADLPPALHGRVTSLRAVTGTRLRPAEVSGTLLRRLAEARPWFETNRWRPFQEDLAAHDWLRDRQVTLSVGQTKVTGKAVGIDEQGALVLLRDDGKTELWRAGDVDLARVSPG